MMQQRNTGLCYNRRTQDYATNEERIIVKQEINTGLQQKTTIQEYDTTEKHKLIIFNRGILNYNTEIHDTTGYDSFTTEHHYRIMKQQGHTVL